jgi:outer membrane usher protein
VRGHEALRNASIIVEPSPFGYTARTDFLNAATQPSLSSYAERTVTVDAPTHRPALTWAKARSASFLPIAGGYRLQVGSDYNVTAVGTLLNGDGEPISLVTGTAVELAHPQREPITVFTKPRRAVWCVRARPRPVAHPHE